MPPRKRGRTGREAAAAPEDDGRDHISALPDDALEHILSFIPALDAARTCVLARRWRHIWKSTKSLRIVTPGSIQDIKEFVDHLLLIRAGSPVDTFELRTQEGMSIEDNARVNLWIRHALACKACVLQFEIFGSTTWLKLKDIHLLFASQYLTRLDFAYVQFRDCFLNFSSCPALQDLRIRRYESLKRLSIADCNSIWTLRTCIHAPNLISLCLDETFHRAPVLEKMPSLVEAVVTIRECNSDICTRTTSQGCNVLECKGCYGIEGDTSCVLLQGLYTVKNMALVALSNPFISRRDLKHYPTFRHLKNLLLNEY
ncbi:hypothetical protein SETIT_8G071000v2 [Setaria italica]|uniref:F-box domain-containing protein n=1 Tax=Setaria italica TaxID=4555 RepID=A0A368S5B6_SETIT|nr:hypothetical protein SETIT_8G071000v2 [Setaria italica]